MEPFHLLLVNDKPLRWDATVDLGCSRLIGLSFFVLLEVEVLDLHLLQLVLQEDVVVLSLRQGLQLGLMLLFAHQLVVCLLDLCYLLLGGRELLPDEVELVDLLIQELLVVRGFVDIALVQVTLHLDEALKQPFSPSPLTSLGELLLLSLLPQSLDIPLPEALIFSPLWECP